MDQEIEEPLQNLGSLIVYKQIRESQGNHGLYHGDYIRYRRYCHNKILKLRKQMKFSFGKRYHKRVIQDELKNDPRVLKILLYRAEKNWSHAMGLKQLINSGVNSKINKNKTRGHLLKKFKKAIIHADQLQKITQGRTEQRTILESESYFYYLKALYYFENEKWESAIEYLAKCYGIYNQIMKVCDQFEQTIYQERIDQINQQTRYCNARAKKNQTLKMDDLIKMQQYSDPTLQAKIEEMMQEYRQAQLTQNKGFFEIEYQDNKYPIKNEKVITLVQKINDSLQLKDLELYGNLFGYFDEAVKLVKQDKDTATSDGEKDIYVKVLAYLNYLRQISTLERNQLQIEQITKKFIQENGINNLQNLQTRKAQKLKLTTPQEIIKYCDNYAIILRQIMDEERNNKDISFFRKLDAQEFYSKSIRCFFVGCMYHSNEKYREAYSLIKYSVDLINMTNRKFTEIKQEPSQLLEQIILLTKEILMKSKLNALKQSNETVSNVKQQLEQLTILDDKKSTTLFELINTTDQVNLDNILQYKPFEITQMMEPLPPKPIQFDIAYSQLRFPTLEEPKKGFFSKINIFKKQ
ncbi:hypothetical protein pb186bvf_016305 [Paramecium bursaria]